VLKKEFKKRIFKQVAGVRFELGTASCVGERIHCATEASMLIADQAFF